MAEDWKLPRTGTNEDPLRLAVFISGSGSGMEALIRHQQNNDCFHKTSLVISDREDASGLSKAQAMGIEAIAVPLPNISDKIEKEKYMKKK